MTFKFPILNCFLFAIRGFISLTGLVGKTEGPLYNSSIKDFVRKIEAYATVRKARSGKLRQKTVCSTGVGSQELTASCCKPQYLWGDIDDPGRLQHQARQELPLENNGFFSSAFQIACKWASPWLTAIWNYTDRRILENVLWMHLCDAEETGEGGECDTELKTDTSVQT